MSECREALDMAIEALEAKKEAHMDSLQVLAIVSPPASISEIQCVIGTELNDITEELKETRREERGQGSRCDNGTD